MNEKVLGIICVIAGGLLHAFHRSEPLTITTPLFPFWTYFIIGVSINSVAILFWIAIKDEIAKFRFGILLWYSILICWPIATDQMIGMFVKFAIQGVEVLQ